MPAATDNQRMQDMIERIEELQRIQDEIEQRITRIEQWIEPLGVDASGAICIPAGD